MSIAACLLLSSNSTHTKAQNPSYFVRITDRLTALCTSEITLKKAFLDYCKKASSYDFRNSLEEQKPKNS